MRYYAFKVDLFSVRRAVYLHAFSVFVLQQTIYLTYEFYDFDEEHPNLNVFDIRPCFNYNQRQSFILKFPGSVIFIAFLLAYSV